MDEIGLLWFSGKRLIALVRPAINVPWRDEPGFFYTWLALIALLALGVTGVDPILRDLSYVLTILYVPPAVSAVACLTGPIRRRPALALLLGLLTYLFAPFGVIRWGLVGLALSLPFALGSALVARSERPWDLSALLGYSLLLLAWRVPFLMVD